MPELLLLVGDPAKARNDNPARFRRAFERAGWQVRCLDHDALEVRRNRLFAAGQPLEAFELIWMLGFGRQASWFDRIQLLKTVDQHRFVTAPDVLTYLHGKHHWLDLMPETHTSADPDYLYSVLRSGGDWVLKPTAGSFGRDVRLISEASVSRDEVRRYWRQLGEGYLLAQRFVADVLAGEKRTLVAAGRLMGSYRRIPTDGLASNLAGGGRAERADLTSQEIDLIEPIARALERFGAGYAAIDTVYPYLMEVNVANPGGLATIETLGGGDLSDAVVAAILSARPC
jgi:hypothetical protein